MEAVAQRIFNPNYILFDSIFLLFLCFLLFIKKKNKALLFGLFGGLLYMVIDYGLFYLLLGTRSIIGGNAFWVLFWLSLSYGITNFAMFWLWFDKDKNVKEWFFLIICWWIVCPFITQTFPSSGPNIETIRISTASHGYMAIILFVGYGIIIIKNIFGKAEKINILNLLLLGVFVQFAWEFSLLVGGIRSAGLETIQQKISTLTVNCLLETNIGIPFFYFFYKYLKSNNALTKLLGSS